jgi:type IV secretory pathway VirB10-like protein
MSRNRKPTSLFAQASVAANLDISVTQTEFLSEGKLGNLKSPTADRKVMTWDVETKNLPPATPELEPRKPSQPQFTHSNNSKYSPSPPSATRSARQSYREHKIATDPEGYLKMVRREEERRHRKPSRFEMSLEEAKALDRERQTQEREEMKKKGFTSRPSTKLSTNLSETPVSVTKLTRKPRVPHHHH